MLPPPDFGELRKSVRPVSFLPFIKLGLPAAGPLGPLQLFGRWTSLAPICRPHSSYCLCGDEHSSDRVGKARATSVKAFWLESLNGPRPDDLGERHLSK